jgi:hypothetical protein
VKTVRRVLFIYCIAATLICAAGAGWGLITANGIAKEVAKKGAELTQLTAQATDLEAVYKNLEAEQRAGRAEFDMARAIEISFKVQMAKDKYEKFKTESAKVAGEYEQISEKHRKQLLFVVPLIALAMLHGIGVPLFYTRKSD